jgi:anaphase-promoting complex subunit 3
MWDAFTELSDSGVPIKPMNIYKLNEDLRRDIFARTASAVATATATAIKVDARKDSDLSTPSTGYDPFNPTRSAVDPGLNHGGPNFMSRLNGVGNIPPAQRHNNSSVAQWLSPPLL